MLVNKLIVIIVMVNGEFCFYLLLLIVGVVFLFFSEFVVIFDFIGMV